MNAEPLIDEARYDDLAKDLTPDSVVEILGAYLQSTPEMVEDIRDAAEDDDREALAQAAHRLKGGSLAVGAGAMTERCNRIERDARDGIDTHELQGQAREVAEVWEQTRAELQRRCSNL